VSHSRHLGSEWVSTGAVRLFSCKRMSTAHAQKSSIAVLADKGMAAIRIIPQGCDPEWS